MNKHLIDITDDYKLEYSNGKAPISISDARIISKLIASIKKISPSTPLLEILDKWKKDEDQEVFNQLDFFIDNFSGSTESKIDFVKIGDHHIRRSSIFSLSKKEKFSSSKGRMLYLITINENDVSSYVKEGTIKEVVYDDWYDRDVEFDDLKNRLSNIINFL